jgi:hypothetical protein
VRRLRTESISVAGLDVSLRAPAAVVIPRGWRPEDGVDDLLSKVVSHEIPDNASRRDRARRLAVLSVAIAEVVADADRIFVEDYSYGSTQTQRMYVAELVGGIKLELWRRGCRVLEPIAISTARKALLGKCPQKNAKEIVQRAFRSAFPGRQWGPDEIDAFVVANAARAGLGLSSLTLAGWETAVLPSGAEAHAQNEGTEGRGPGSRAPARGRRRRRVAQ